MRNTWFKTKMPPRDIKLWKSIKKVTESVEKSKRRAVLGRMEGVIGQTGQLPSIKPSSESPTRENEKMSEHLRTNNNTVRTGLRRMEKCYRLELSSYLIWFSMILGILVIWNRWWWISIGACAVTLELFSVLKNVVLAPNIFRWNLADWHAGACFEGISKGIYQKLFNGFFLLRGSPPPPLPP